MSLIRFGQVGVAVLAFAALSAIMAPAQSGPGCDDSPNAAKFLANSKSTFGKLDSAGAARLGWQAVPKTMALVTQPAKCEAIIAAHNAYVSKGNATMKVSRASIVQADGTYLVEVTPATPGSERVIFVYDSTYKFRVVY